ASPVVRPTQTVSVWAAEAVSPARDIRSESELRPQLRRCDRGSGGEQNLEARSAQRFLAPAAVAHAFRFFIPSLRTALRTPRAAPASRRTSSRRAQRCVRSGFR